MLTYQKKLRDEQWTLLESIIAARRSPGTQGKNNRLFIEAVIFIVPNQYPWPALPAEFGNWPTVYIRFKRWSRSGLWRRLAQGSRADRALHLVLEEIANFGDRYLPNQKIQEGHPLSVVQRVIHHSS